VIKRLFLATIFVLTFLSFFNSNKVFAALDDCVCETIDTPGDGKDCKPRAGTTCSAGNQPFCISNIDGGCNRNLFDGGSSCVCKPSGYVPYTTEDTTFCNSDGVRSGNPKINTAIGCIPVKLDSFFVWFLPFVFSISGGIAFLLMVYGFITISTSKGDPKAIQGARETITSAITGLLISIFAIFILRLIALDILKIPGIL